jgi:hypothetical protein
MSEKLGFKEMSADHEITIKLEPMFMFQGDQIEIGPMRDKSIPKDKIPKAHDQSINQSIIFFNIYA